MALSESVQNVLGVVKTAQTIFILIPKNPTFDQAATATSLFLFLNKRDKDVALFSPQSWPKEWRILAGSDRVTDKMGRQNLHIIFDYQKEAIDKVSYHIDEENNKFTLVVQPQKGHRPLDSKTVEFDYGGAEADLIFLIGVKDWSDLGHLYEDYQSLYRDSATVGLSRFASRLANINLDFSAKPSLSEGVLELLQAIDSELGADVATNLLAGIEERTNHFASLIVTADTFQKAAMLMKQGARRIGLPKFGILPAAPEQVKKTKKKSVPKQPKVKKAKNDKKKLVAVLQKKK